MVQKEGRRNLNKNTNIKIMTTSARGGIWAFDVPCPQYLEVGKLYRCKSVGWYGVGFNFALGESFRVFSRCWFPAGSIVVCNSLCDIDCYLVDPERTCDCNNFCPEWLKENEPNNLQLNLF